MAKTFEELLEDADQKPLWVILVALPCYIVWALAMLFLAVAYTFTRIIRSILGVISLLTQALRRSYW